MKVAVNISHDYWKLLHWSLNLFLHEFLFSGPLKFFPRTSKLSNSNNLQKLQANSSVDWLNSHSKEETQANWFLCSFCHVHWTYLFYTCRLSNLTEILLIWCHHYFTSFSFRCCDWKCAGAGYEEAQSSKQWSSVLFVWNRIYLFICHDVVDWALSKWFQLWIKGNFFVLSL